MVLNSSPTKYSIQFFVYFLLYLLISSNQVYSPVACHGCCVMSLKTVSTFRAVNVLGFYQLLFSIVFNPDFISPFSLIAYIVLWYCRIELAWRKVVMIFTVRAANYCMLYAMYTPHRRKPLLRINNIELTGFIIDAILLSEVNI